MFISSLTILGSAKVDVSPRLSKSLEAIFLRILLIILPDLVLGKSLVKCIKSGFAIAPISYLLNRLILLSSSLGEVFFIIFT
ncbi:MAG: hypothetical protein CM15mP22_3830 [Gammaproteobacteria bacterium]|nr:MAG: hypothetical protein CM15mP22_3830 [Gammaproteobacteria bacterium]